MPPTEHITCPLARGRVVDEYFLEHRAKLIDIAAFLDRVDRARGDDRGDDFRMAAFRKALAILNDREPGRAGRILDAFSDHATSMPQSAHGMKGASGAPSVTKGGAV